MKKAPNVIIILADDMGIGDLECYNPQSKIPTPNMNEIAAQGKQYCDAHSSSAVCTPSRYGLLTGRYCWRGELKQNVIGGYAAPLIHEGRKTIASYLKGQGYATAAIGKWHLGMNFMGKDGTPVIKPGVILRDASVVEDQVDFSADITGGPVAVGFDYFYGSACCPTCHAPYAYIENERFVKPPVKYWDTPMYTSRAGMMAEDWDHKEVDVTFAEKAVEYIKAHQNDEQPFFLYLAASAPHEPCVDSVVPQFAKGKSQAGARGDLVWLFDWMVGRVNGTLKECGLQDDTLLIVTSDNGALPGERLLNEQGEDYYVTFGHKSSGDFKGYKAHYWEGGHREPLLVQWNGHIEPNTTSEALVGLQDISATLQELLEGQAVKTTTAFEDATSFCKTLFGNDTSPRKNMIHHSASGVFAFRYGKWKLVVNAEGSGGWPHLIGQEDVVWPAFQLYDMEKDPYETNNIYQAELATAKKLEAILAQQMEQGHSNIDCCTLQAL